MPPKKRKFSSKAAMKTRTSKHVPVSAACDPLRVLPRECALCDQPTNSLDDCAQHIVSAHLQQLSVCCHCRRAFSSKEELDVHLKRHKGSKGTISCPFCPLYFQRLSLLRKHDSERHSGVRSGLILDKYIPFLSAQLNMSFHKYMRQVECGGDLVCHPCGYKTDKVPLYLQHVAVCPKPKHVCDKCGLVFKKKKYTIKHIQFHCLHLKDEGNVATRRVTCKTCSEKFHPDDYDNHKKTCRDTKCIRCGKVFKSMVECNDHFTKEHHDNSLKIKTCPYCRMEFISTAMLDKHVKVHEKYRCRECNKQFRTPKPLLQHFKKHKQLEPYRCVPCDVNFKEGFDFKTHITQHENRGYINFDEQCFVVFSLEPPKKPADDNTEEAADIDEAEQETSQESVADTSVDIENTIIEEVTVEGNHEEPDKSESFIVEESPVTRTRRKRKRIIFDEPDSDSETLARKKKKIAQKRLKKMIWKKKNPTAKIYTCTVCCKRMYELSTYNRHLNMHFRAGAKQCLHCAKILPNRATLDSHVKKEHSEPKPTSNALHRYLKERAQLKLQSILSRKREEQRQALREKIMAAMQKPPFKMVLTKVAAPTYDIIKNGRILSIGSSVTITHSDGSNKKVEDLTLQKYVENFQPDDTQDKVTPMKSQSKIQPLTTSKSLKIRSVRSTISHQLYKIKMKPFKEHKESKVKGIKPPTEVSFTPEYHEVTVKKVDEYQPSRKLDFGIPMDLEEAPTEDYFEADFYNEGVAQVEITSTPQMKGKPKKGKGYVVEVTGEPTNEEMEAKLEEVCKKLELPVQKNQLHIGQLTTSAPFFRIVNVKKVLKNEKKKQFQMKIKKRFQEIKIGNSPMVQVNPLAHLMKEERPPPPELGLEITPIVD